MLGKKKALLLGNPVNIPYVYPSALLREISKHVDWVIPLTESATLRPSRDPLPPATETEVIFSTWGMPELGEDFLEKVPDLEAVFYAAGSIRGFAHEAGWRRGIRIFSAARANAIPVAEFTVAQLILGLKHAHALKVSTAADWHKAQALKDSMRGNFQSRVGLVSYGVIARHVRKLLRGYDYNLLVYDPFISEAEAREEGIQLVDLQTLFQECHAVSLHAPLLEETRGLIRGHHLESMQENAVFINTARGALVNQPEMVEVLRRRRDLLAILDVVDPEPPEEGDPVLGLPNAWITPHLAGSMGHECGRMGTYMLGAYQDFLAGNPSELEVLEADLGRIA